MSSLEGCSEDQLSSGIKYRKDPEHGTAVHIQSIPKCLLYTPDIVVIKGKYLYDESYECHTKKAVLTSH